MSSAKIHRLCTLLKVTKVLRRVYTVIISFAVVVINSALYMDGPAAVVLLFPFVFFSVLN